MHCQTTDHHLTMSKKKRREKPRPKALKQPADEKTDSWIIAVAKGCCAGAYGMQMSTANLQTKILTRQSKPGEYNVYRAGLEWDLTDPIVIDGSDDFKSTPRWHDRLKPYRHQVTNLITFCRRLPVTLLADDVGLGKTISAGLVMSELIVRSRLSKTLIRCRDKTSLNNPAHSAIIGVLVGLRAALPVCRFCSRGYETFSR